MVSFRVWTRRQAVARSQRHGIAGQDAGAVGQGERSFQVLVRPDHLVADFHPRKCAPAQHLPSGPADGVGNVITVQIQRSSHVNGRRSRAQGVSVSEPQSASPDLGASRIGIGMGQNQRIAGGLGQGPISGNPAGQGQDFSGGVGGAPEGGNGAFLQNETVAPRIGRHVFPAGKDGCPLERDGARSPAGAGGLGIRAVHC